MTDFISHAQVARESVGLGLLLRARLARMRRDHPDGAAAFVLRHGELKRGALLPAGAPLGLPQHCYWNALRGSLMLGWAYVEGFATHPGVETNGERGVAILHAWNEDDAGRVVDLTWHWRRTDLAECGWYMGVKFSAARAHDCTWHGDACVITDPRPDAVTRGPWAGEPSPGDMRGLVETIARDMSAQGADAARLATQLRTAAIRERWPST